MSVNTETAVTPAYTWSQLTKADFPRIAPMLEETLAAEAYYTLAADASEEDRIAYWFGGKNCEVWALEEKGEILGVYYQRPNQAGLGAHIANGGYMVNPAARGRGIGRILGEHSIEKARERGFRGIQFNFVVASNAAAVALWQHLGFKIIGTIPGAFHFKRQRYDDAYIMFLDLTV